MCVYACVYLYITKFLLCNFAFLQMTNPSAIKAKKVLIGKMYAFISKLSVSNGFTGYPAWACSMMSTSADKH